MSDNNRQRSEWPSTYHQAMSVELRAMRKLFEKWLRLIFFALVAITLELAGGHGLGIGLLLLFAIVSQLLQWTRGE